MSLNSKELRLKVMGFAHWLIEAKRRNSARRRARRNQQLLDTRHRRDDDRL